MTAQPVIIGVNFGPPTVTSQLPVTTQDGGQFLVTALADCTVLDGQFSTAVTDATTADTDTETLVTNVNTVVTDATTAKSAIDTVVTNNNTTDTDNATNLTDFDLVATTATNGIVALLNTAGGGPLTYNSGTHQYSGACGTSSTISQANGNALIALLNTLGTALVDAKAASATGKTNATTAQTNGATTVTDATTAQTNANTTEAAVDAVLADVTAMNTTAVRADIVSAQAVLGSNLIVRTDKSVCASQSVMNAGLVAALALVNSNVILPP